VRDGVVICTHPENVLFFENLAESLNGFAVYPVHVVVNGCPEMVPEYWSRLKTATQRFDCHTMTVKPEDTFELGALETARDDGKFDQIFLLQDSCEVKNPDLFRLAFEEYRGRTVALGHNLFMFLGKYLRQILDVIELPQIRTKGESIRHEVEFNHRYLQRDPAAVFLQPQLCDGSVFEEKFGRRNMILENPWIKKYKGKWSL
jgi:hypothetical protein